MFYRSSAQGWVPHEGPHAAMWRDQNRPEPPINAMRVAPGTDAVVFKPWDTSHLECEL